MSDHVFERKTKGKLPVLAICYDFDKTLSPDDMQAQGFIQSVGYDAENFWLESNKRAEQNNMDQNLAYMYKMVDEAREKFAFTKQTLMEYGAKVSLFPGVEGWFERIRQYGRAKGVIVEHYIISSGVKEMIEGTSVAKSGAFERIYANSFFFDENGVARWPAQAVNFTNKTQFLFRIEKGVLDINDPKVNDPFAPEEIRVPFRNMVYLGDSDTDVPCMRLVNSYGGHSVGVYNPKTGDKSKVNKMMREGRIKYYVPADYSEGTELDRLVKAIIDKTASEEILENVYYRCKNETAESDKRNSEAKQRKTDLINALDNSRSFATTHMLIGDLKKLKNWTAAEKQELFEIAERNSQVFCILNDPDVKAFYRGLLKGMKELDGHAKAVRGKVEQGSPDAKDRTR